MKKNLKLILSIISICIIILIVILAVIKYNYDKTIKRQMESAIHAITIENDIDLLSKPNAKRKIKNIERGSSVYILENVIDDNGKEWCKVSSDGKIGYVLTEKTNSFKKGNMKKELMLDVSKFNLKNNFKNINDFKYFIIKNNIKYVYIRAGGRGYGEAGKFYEDPNYKEYSDACEYLGIPFGYYFLEEAITSTEVDEEVKFINDFIEKNKYSCNTLPIALDVEQHIEKGRADGIWDTRANLVNELIKKLEESKNKVILYSNANITNKYLTSVNAKMWLAYYPSTNEIPNYWYSNTSEDGAKNEELISKMVAWQFTETGVKNQIDSKVDISVVYSCFFDENSMNDINNDISGKSYAVRKIFNLKNKGKYKSISSLYTSITYEKK